MRPSTLALSISLILLLIVWLPFHALAAGGIKQITAPEVKQMLDEEKGTVINVLSALEYDMQHIPGSINIPVAEMTSTDKLPHNQHKPLVFYAMGRGWGYSKRAAMIALKRGYINVYVFAGGIPKWRQFTYPVTINREWQKIRTKKIPPADFKTVLDQKGPYILDVSPIDFGTRHFSFMKGSVSCPLMFMDLCYEKIPKDREIVILDQAMKQSPVAAKFLTTKGYHVIGVLTGGIDRWEGEGFEVQKKVHLIAP